MKNEVLVIFENEQIYLGALIYAREYALRMDAKVTFLMLVEMTFSSADDLSVQRNALHQVEVRVGKLMADLTRNFIEKGLEVSSALKAGDPSQELVKFMADRPAFQAAIWGSGEDFISMGDGKQKHWLQYLANHFECPLLTLTRRKDGLRKR